MRKSQYTPGPWELKIDKDGGNWTYRIQSTANQTPNGYGMHICNANAMLEAKGEENARLIAAAPEMLEALKKALNEIEASVETSFTISQQYVASVIRDAIAKATGGTK